jgi:PAS domain S-box-containing protein
LHSDAAILLIRATEDRHLRAASWCGLTPEQAVGVLPFMQSDHELIALAKPWAVPDVSRDRSGRCGFTLLALEPAGFRSFASIPLTTVAGDTAGVLAVMGRKRARFARTALDAAKVIGEHAVELAIIHEELRGRRVGEAQLRALVDSLPEAIIRFDAAGTVESSSPSATVILGHPAEDLIGHPFHALLHPADRARVLDPIAERAARGGPVAFGRSHEVRVVRKDGRAINAELTICEIEPRARFVGIIRDVDDRRSTEARLRQSDRLNALGTLAAGLGHDMNNMLLPIRAHLNAIEAISASASPRAGVHVAEIRCGVNYLQQLADGLHYLATDAGPSRDHRNGTDLARWWASTGSLLSRALPPLTTVKSVIRPDLPRVQVSEQALTQAVLNLFVNAGEAITTAHGASGGHVAVRVHASPDGRSLILSVEDNGVGMDEEVRKRAFDVFFTTKSRGVGSGLGLALVHRVVTEAGGAASIDSVRGVGTTMRLHLPIVELVPEGTGARVAVSLADGRASAFACAALEARGLLAVPADEPVADADAWVADPRVVSAPVARRWVDARAGRVVILFGRLTPVVRAHWRGIARVMVDHGNDFDALLVGVDRACTVILKERQEPNHGRLDSNDRLGGPGGRRPTRACP